jgi:tetratricopeptide (TPR) repeat protein
MIIPFMTQCRHRVTSIALICVFSLCLFTVTSADPYYSPNQGKMPLKVQFSIPGGEACDTVTWDFGDGNSSSEMNPSYAYNRMGFFYPLCVCTLPGATITYTFDKVVASNADMFDADTADPHYPYHTQVDITSETLSLTNQIKQGTGLYALGQYQYAEKSYQKVLKMSDPDPMIFAEYGTILLKLSRWDEAKKAFNQSISLKPDADVLNAYAHLLIGTKKYDDALEAFNQSLKINDKSASAWAGRGEVLGLLEQLDEAAAAYETSVSLDADQASTWKGYGEVLTAMGNHEDAVSAYEKAIGLGMSGADIYLKYGGALRKLGRDGDAQNAMNQARSFQGPLYSSSDGGTLHCTAGGAL